MGGVRIGNEGKEKAKTKGGNRGKGGVEETEEPRGCICIQRESRIGYIRLEKRLQKNGHRSKDNSTGHISHQDSISKERHP